MAVWQITIRGKGVQKRSVESLVDQLKFKFDKASIDVKDASPPESRSDRFAAAMALVEDANSEVETLKDELQDWYDNLPQQFQDGEKGEQLQDAINDLESLYSDLETAAGTEISFPSMMG